MLRCCKKHQHLQLFSRPCRDMNDCSRLANHEFFPPMKSKTFTLSRTRVLQCDYNNWGHPDKVDQSDYRKITIHSEKVSCQSLKLK